MARTLLVYIITMAGIVTVLGADTCGGQNEHYSCRKADKTCASLNETSSDDNQDPEDQDPSVNSTECKEECYCNPGTARDENNVCVPYDQCNKPCGDEETKDYCPVKCPIDNCPKSENSVSCPRPKICPSPQCKCRFNYRRADNGTCIPTRDCPPFECNKPFEEYNSCPPICPNGYCGQATPNGRCPAIFGRIGIVLECNPKCRCKSGYFWNENKECIPYNQCPCGPDETKNYCPVECPTDYCPKKELKSVSCPQPKLCPKPQCKCRFNSRRAYNGTCIPTDQCPPFACEKPNEVYDPCPPLCPNGNCDQATPDGSCPQISGQILIVLECNPRCRCKDGFWWNSGNVCVPYDQCPGKSNATSTTQ